MSEWLAFHWPELLGFACGLIGSLHPQFWRSLLIAGGLVLAIYFFHGSRSGPCRIQAGARNRRAWPAGRIPWMSCASRAGFALSEGEEVSSGGTAFAPQW